MSLGDALFGDAGYDADAGDGRSILGNDSALGDVWCGNNEYVAAATAVGNLSQLMQNAPAAVREANKAEVNALLSTWNAYQKQRDESTLAKLNPAFLCNFKTLGAQAERIAARVAAASGQAPPVNAPELRPGTLGQLGEGLETAVKTITTLGGLALAAYLASQVVAVMQRRKHVAASAAQ